MHDYSAGHISAEDGSGAVWRLFRKIWAMTNSSFYPGVGYRHLMVWRNGEDQHDRYPPPRHNRPGDMAIISPKGEGADRLIYLMNASQMLSSTIPNTRADLPEDELPANSVWFWGHGKAPKMESFSGNSSA